ncbi:hypothetical protein ACHAXH_000324 [Discostella pseudostelligera]
MPQLHLIPLFPASHDQQVDTAMTIDFSGGVGGEGNTISPPKRKIRIRNHHGRPICSFPGCFKSIQAKGVCCQHGAKTSRSKCRVPRCQNSSQRGGLCRRHGSEKLQICTVESCPKWGRYCDRHTMAISTELANASVGNGDVGELPTTVRVLPLPPPPAAASIPAVEIVTPPSPSNNNTIFPPPSSSLPPPPSFAGRNTTTPKIAHLNNKDFYTNLAQVIGFVPNPLQPPPPPPPPPPAKSVPLPPPPPTDNSNNVTGNTINTSPLTGKRIVVVDKDFYQKLAVRIAVAQERQMAIRNTTTTVPQVQQACAPVRGGFAGFSVPTPPMEVVAPPVVEMNYENYFYTNGEECNNNDSNEMMIPENHTAPSSFVLQPSPPTVLPNTMMATVGGVSENHSTPAATSFVLQPSPSVVLPTAIAATTTTTLPAEQVQTIVTNNVVDAAAQKERVGRLVQLAIPNIFSDEINDQNLRTARILHAARMAVIRAATANNNATASIPSLPVQQHPTYATTTQMVGQNHSPQTTTGTSPTTIITTNQWSN